MTEIDYCLTSLFRDTPEEYTALDSPSDHSEHTGIFFWRNIENELHREGDQPAIIEPDGSQYWYVNGKLHRENDKPASIRSNGYIGWFYHGLLHRECDNPAVILKDTAQQWYHKGKLHREGDQPASISKFI